MTGWCSFGRWRNGRNPRPAETHPRREGERTGRGSRWIGRTSGGERSTSGGLQGTRARLQTRIRLEKSTSLGGIFNFLLLNMLNDRDNHYYIGS